MTLVRLAVLAFFTLGVVTAQAGDWTRFRGPNGAGVSDDKAAIPESWSSTENLAWKAELPGPGVSSPIVVGDRVFVTCYSGYGTDRRNPGDIENLKRHLVCVDATSGKILWRKTVDAVLPEDPYSGIGVTAHGYASHTPVTDGERVYVFFGKTGVMAFDMEGKQLWKTGVGKESDPRRWGSSSSPILYKDWVIVTAAAESQAVVALEKATGKEVWRQEAAGLDNVWGTPALVELDDRVELIVGVPYEIWGFNPENGKLRWYCNALDNDQMQSSVVVHDGVIYVIEGRGGGSAAIRPGGKGDVTNSHVVWTGRHAARYCSPVIHEGKLYYFSNGTAGCVDAKSGETIYRERLQGGNQGSGGGGRSRFGGFGGRSDYSSPVVADGKVFYVNGSGSTYVLKAGDKFEQLSVNRVTDENESFGGSPAVSNGRLFLRSDKHLYCIAAPDAKEEAAEASESE